MSNDRVVVEAAEAVVRDAADGVEQTIDSVGLPLRLAAEQLQAAAYAAQDALTALFKASEAYAPLHASACRQLNALGLSLASRPDPDASLRETGVTAEGSVLLHGAVYTPGHSPIKTLGRTLSYVLNEVADLPGGTRLEIRLHGATWEEC